MSCDTRSPTANSIEFIFFPVARGGAAVTVLVFLTNDGESDDDEALRHSIRFSGISSRKRDAGLYVGAPHDERYSAREI